MGTPEIISAKLTRETLLERESCLVSGDTRGGSHATCTPEIDTGTIGPRSEQNIRCPVPQRYHLSISLLLASSYTRDRV